MSVSDKTRPGAPSTMVRMLDLDRILAFITSHARLLDRRRAELAVGAGDADAALAVLAGYRNADGGFGWALEPEVLSEAADWMDRQRALWGRLFDVVDEYLKEERSA